MPCQDLPKEPVRPCFENFAIERNWTRVQLEVADDCASDAESIVGTFEVSVASAGAVADRHPASFGLPDDLMSAAGVDDAEVADDVESVADVEGVEDVVQLLSK